MVMVNIQGSEKENSEGPSEMNRKKKTTKTTGTKKAEKLTCTASTMHIPHPSQDLCYIGKNSLQR